MNPSHKFYAHLLEKQKSLELHSQVSRVNKLKSDNERAEKNWIKHCNDMDTAEKVR